MQSVNLFNQCAVSNDKEWKPHFLAVITDVRPLPLGGWMPIPIGSNIASMMAQRQLSAASNSYAQSLQRLSSGQRINTASDDAAGLAISSSLNTDGRVFSQALRNLNDGLSLLAIADGAVEQLAAIVTRQRELATQAANGTYGTKQRQALDTEAQALSKEYFRIARTTSFNGMKLFDGSLGQVVLQGGYGTLGSIASSLGGKMGDGTFQLQVSLFSGAGPYAATAADVNRDGFEDLISVNNTANTASVLLSNGDGTYKAPLAFATGLSPYAVTVADFNQDGIVDIASADFWSSSVSILLGNGNGTFKANTCFTTGSWPNWLTSGDLNGDGTIDIVSSDWGGNSLSILIGNGNGSFRTSISLAVSGPNGVQAVDINSDGMVDLITAENGSNTLAIFLGNGNGTFRARVSLSAGSWPNSVAVADLNNDGILDLVSADYSSNTVSTFIGNGNGTFQARKSFTSGVNPYVVIAADFNGDGILDLASADNGSNSLSLLLGNGDGSFWARRSISTGTQPRMVTVLDVDRDGVMDLVTADGGSNSLSIFKGNVRDGIGPQQSFSLATRQDSLVAMTQFAGNLDRLSQQRATIGAFQSRISSAVATLMTTKENYAAAESRIKDTDVAFESSQELRANIIQKVATAVLAQANQQPTIALQLLQG